MTAETDPDLISRLEKLESRVRTEVTMQDGSRLQGWLEFTSSEGDSSEVAVEGTFDVAFCS